MAPRLGRARRLNVFFGLAALVVGMLGGVFALLEPAAQASNIGCPQGTSEYKVDANPLAGLSNGQSAPFTVSGVTFTFTKVAGPAPFVDDTFDFASSAAVSTVLVKGGDDTNVYNYDPAVTSGSALHPPLNGGDEAPTISHVVFCIGTPGTTTSSSTVPQSSTSTSTSTTATSTSTSTSTSTTVPETTTSTTVPQETTTTTIPQETTTTTVPQETTTTSVHGATTIVTTTTLHEQGSTIPTTSTTEPVAVPGQLPRTGSGSAVAAMFAIMCIAAGVLLIAGRRKPWVRSS
jgi:LPXTG-motif cell wall-anchored protein